MEMAKRIKAQRKLQKMRQQDLANKMGVSLITVKRWENEKINRCPNASIMSKLADVLDTSVGYLMGTEEEMLSDKPTLNILEDKNNVSSISFWGEVVDDAQKAAKNGKNLDIIINLVNTALGILQNAIMKQSTAVSQPV